LAAGRPSERLFAATAPRSFRPAFYRVANHNGVTVHRLRACDLLSAGLAFAGATARPSVHNGSFCWTLSKFHTGRARTYARAARALSGASGMIVNHASRS
jgi:hypothetical protein